MKRKPKCIICYVEKKNGTNTTTKIVESNEIFFHTITEADLQLVFKDGKYFTHVNYENVLWYKLKTDTIMFTSIKDESVMHG